MENSENLAQNQKPKSNTIWYILGGCVLLAIILVILAAIILFFAAGWLKTETSKNKIPSIDQNFSQDIDDTLKKLDELDKNLSDLEKNIKEESLNPPKEDAQPPIQPLQVGTIEGNLSYPSEQIPDLTVCAQDINGSSSPYCTTSLINDSKYTAGRGYMLEVAPGDYYVYSYFIDPVHTAYYTEFVTCGLDISCPSHDKIVVHVNNGDHLTNIDPVDWYNY